MSYNIVRARARSVTNSPIPCVSHWLALTSKSSKNNGQCCFGGPAEENRLARLAREVCAPLSRRQWAACRVCVWLAAMCRTFSVQLDVQREREFGPCCASLGSSSAKEGGVLALANGGWGSATGSDDAAALRGRVSAGDLSSPHSLRPQPQPQAGDSASPR